MLCSLLCLAVFLVYAPGWEGPFVFDDQLNILENPDVPMYELSERDIINSALSNESGPLKRVIPALSFGLNYYFADGFFSVHFKLTNIAIHCINSALVFWLLNLLWPCVEKRSWVAQSRFSNPRLVFATSGALVWALHAFLLTSVLYIVQRMTSMASLFMLMGTCLYVVGRQTIQDKPWQGMGLMSLGLVAGTILGMACKENAALLPVYLAALELTLLSQLDTNRVTRIKVRWFFALFVGLPVVAGLVYWALHPNFIVGGYGGRPFSFLERVLTEPRVLWFYLYMILLPDIRTMGLFHDDFPLSTGLFTPWTTLPAILGIVSVLVLALWWRKKFPVFAFAVLWFLVGHGLESTLIPLEIIHEHRNYLPALGPLFAVAYLLVFSLPDKLPNLSRVGLIGLVVVCLGMGTFNRAQYWRSESALIESLANNHPASPSSQYLRGEILRKRERDFEGAYAYYLRAAELSPHEVGFLISLSMVTLDGMQQFEDDLQSIKLARPEYIAGKIHELPVSAWGIRALDVAIRCVMSGNERCLSKADDVSLWLQAIIDKPNGKPPHRYYASVHLFNIRMKQNDFASADRAASAAARLYPGHPRFILMQAHALIGLKQLPEAERLITAVERSPAMRYRKYASQVQQLKRAIDFIRAQNQGETPGDPNVPAIDPGQSGRAPVV